VTADEVITALDLPSATRVDRRVPKSMLVEHGAPTAADRRQVNEGIEQIQWVAALKPTTIGIAAYRDAGREYLEIAVLRVVVRERAKAQRLIELLHRAIPYPMFAVTAQRETVTLSVAHKRWSQSETERAVVDGEIVAVTAPRESEVHGPAFTAALALGRQPQASLKDLYQGWLDTLLALDAARLSGVFGILPDAERRAARREAIGDCARLDAEIQWLRSAAKKEKQMARLVALNQELKRAEAARATALARL
jgi:hypothetical protein